MAHAQVTDLSVVESGDDAVLTWGTGTAPYRVLRSTSPDFYFGNRIVADDLSSSSVQDAGALRPGNHSYFYDVLVDGESDPTGLALNPPSASPPTITGISPGNGEPGDLVTISGNGFVADGSRMIVTFHHAIAELVTASETSLQVVVPAGAYTGSVLVCTWRTISSTATSPLASTVPRAPVSTARATCTCPARRPSTESCRARPAWISSPRGSPPPREST